MLGKYLLYAGLSKKEYDDLKPEILEGNRKNLQVYSVIAFVFLFVMFLLSYSLEILEVNRLFYAIGVIISCIVLFMAELYKEDQMKMLICMYLFEGGLFAFGIILGAVTNPEQQVTTFIALLLAAPLLFMDRPVRVDLCILASMVIFCVIASCTKPEDIMQTDMINVIIFGSVSMIISFSLTRSKIERLLYEKRIKQISEEDQLTGLYNRRMYEHTLKELATRQSGLATVIAIDVNGLKTINDTLGHTAGDELIKGAAACISKVFDGKALCFRTGGDEFSVLSGSSDWNFKELIVQLHEETAKWHGVVVDSLSMSVGIAQSEEEKEMETLVMKADLDMYNNKSIYYQKKGIDRRGQQEAFNALCESYTKILKVNLTEDTYHIIQMDIDEREINKGFSDSISEWLCGFANSGLVHPDDKDVFFDTIRLDGLRDYFKGGKASFGIQYRRKIGNDFKKVLMEMIPAKEYTEQNQIVYLYVKNIDL